MGKDRSGRLRLRDGGLRGTDDARRPDRGYHTTLVTDCCASSTHAAHDDALVRMTDGHVIRGYTGRTDRTSARA
jgi:nicotinamidase-related amidase